MKKIVLASLLMTATLAAQSQIYVTRSGNILLLSDTPLESIHAENKEVEAAIDVTHRNIAFSLPLKSFVFKRSLMQTHFNENYVESDKYPTSTFSGSFAETIPPGKDGSFPVRVRGRLTIHGVTKEVDVPATLVRKGNILTGMATFKLNPTDYNITIPYIVRNKIEKETTLQVKVDCIQK